MRITCAKLAGGRAGGQNRDIHLTFPGPRLQRGYQVSPHDVTTEALCHDYQASLHFTVLGAIIKIVNCKCNCHALLLKIFKPKKFCSLDLEHCTLYAHFQVVANNIIGKFTILEVGHHSTFKKPVQT